MAQGPRCIEHGAVYLGASMQECLHKLPVASANSTNKRFAAAVTTEGHPIVVDPVQNTLTEALMYAVGWLVAQPLPALGGGVYAIGMNGAAQLNSAVTALIAIGRLSGDELVHRAHSGTMCR